MGNHQRPIYRVVLLAGKEDCGVQPRWCSAVIHVPSVQLQLL